MVYKQCSKSKIQNLSHAFFIDITHDRL